MLKNVVYRKNLNPDTSAQPMFKKPNLLFASMALLGTFSVASVMNRPSCAQEASENISLGNSSGKDGAGTIIIHAQGEPPEPPVFYTASANATAQVGSEHIEQVISLAIKVIQGDAKTLSFALRGSGQVTDVEGENLQSWSIRQDSTGRFLDLHIKESVTAVAPVIKVRSAKLDLPSVIDVTHIAPGNAIGFNSIVEINYAPGVDGTITTATGFAPLDASETTDRFQTATGGSLELSLNWDGTSPAPVELTDTTLTGNMHANGKSIIFQLRSTAHVTEANTEITVLSGNAAVSNVPSHDDYRLRLSTRGEYPVYKLAFAETGTFPVALDFVVKLDKPKANWQGMDFTVAAGAVVPLTLSGLDSELEFHRDQQSVVPLRNNDNWLGFLPATGHAKIQWKSARKTDQGKLFFTTTAIIEAQVSAGLLRQDHQIDYQVLQAELNSLSLVLAGPGEILDVQGDNVLAWTVTGDEGSRRLDVTLSQPITANSQIRIRSQTPLGAFPVRADGLRLDPVGAIRHSGYLRLSNLGSVRVEPTELVGLTQLAPNQFPGDPINTRQSFVYRFPASDHAFTVAADRIQPEVNISQLVVYRLSETDRVINADIELDVREAPIREWDFGIPGDYSVVSVTGASVADYIAASEVTDDHRNLKVVFGQDVSGRQLVSLHLEKSEAAGETDWILPRIEYPEAKTVRGSIGIGGAPGFRIVVVETNLLVEKPLSYFPKPTADLQQAFRIRESGWTATMRVELLDRNVQSDVFHLYSLSQETVYGSALINYFVTGAPVSEWRLTVPQTLGNVMVDGQDVRTWRREGDTMIVTLHQPVMGAYTLLLTFEEKPDASQGSFQAGQIAPLEVHGERGYIQVVSPMQVELSTLAISDGILKLDPLELPAEFRLLSTAPPLGTWQYTERPFDLSLKVNWFQSGTVVTQVVEFSEANSRVSQDGEFVTDVLYYVKTRGQRTLKLKLPDDPVRLWKASVNGQPVNARQTEDVTLIPLPGRTDPNVPVQISLRLGKPSVDGSNPELTLPIVFAPVLKTQWNIVGDEQRVLVPGRGTVAPSVPVRRPPGFDWLAKRGIVSLLVIGLFAGFGVWATAKAGALRLLGLLGLAIAVAVAATTAMTAMSQTTSLAPLQLSVPVLSAQEAVELQVKNTPLWRIDLSWPGVAACLIGIAALVWSFTMTEMGPKENGDDQDDEDSASTFVLKHRRELIRGGSIFLIAIGVLLQRGGAPWFFALLALTILILLFAPPAWACMRAMPSVLRGLAERRKTKRAKRESAETASGAKSGPSGGAATATIILVSLVLSVLSNPCLATVPAGFDVADSIKQQWLVTNKDARLTASGTIMLSGQPGDRFLLLSAPAVLTRFEGERLHLTKRELPGQGLAYIIGILANDEASSNAENAESISAAAEYQATFEYQLEALKPTEGVPVLTGIAAVQEIRLSYDEAGWDVISPSAVLVEAIGSDVDKTSVKVLLGPEKASIVLKPKARDVSTEERLFFVEMANLYLPGPGVVDGRHRFHIRPAQGQVNELIVLVPNGLTVSAVKGPIESWQFDADRGRLKLDVEATQSQEFDVLVDTQRSLDPLPTDVNLAPLQVADADGEVGLVAVAFAADAQPESLETDSMFAVNIGDFDASLITNKQAVLHRVYRYGADGGELALRVAPVDPEVRCISKQVLSLGDERVVLAVNFATEILRAGLFQLTFSLPDGFEVESLTGAALHHWSELTEGDQRRIILHFNGKTIGTQTFSLTLAGTAPTEVGEWKVPRFELREASRQTGELVVRPTTGIRLRTASRQNVSETDPRMMGGTAQGALAFRLLQRDWDLVLGIEKLDPWVTGQVLHEIMLREGQTRSALLADFDVQNASIRSLRVALPIETDEEIRSLRASGNIVSDFVRTVANSNIWEVQFERRVVGRIQFRIEYERRGERENDNETLSPAAFPQARQVAYFFGVRAGGRLEVELDELSQGWQRVDWSTVPQTLRDAKNRNAPAVVLRAVAPDNAITLQAKRHSLANALKLRVSEGTLTTVLSPTGDQLTAVDLTMEVIQRSSLSIGLPEGGELFSIFVNDESVNSVRLGTNANAWQFYILPGIDDRTAKVRFVYSVAGSSLNRLRLRSPQLNVPLERIEWNVVAPKGLELTDNDGNLELIRHTNQEKYDRDSYLSRISGKRRVQAQQAAQLLEQANQLLQAGEQTKARWALNSVANQYALDAAANEDARVQLENLQTQQAIVGLNTRRQRLYLDNDRTATALLDNKQLREAAAENPVLQQDQLNFRPQQLSQLLQGNSTKDNAVLQQIAGRLVQHQRTTEPAPQAIIISLPEEGSVYTFGRSVQVAENAPLELDLRFGLQRRRHLWQTVLALSFLGAFTATLVFATTR